MHAWMHGCTDAWMHGCMDAWMHGWKTLCFISYLLLKEYLQFSFSNNYFGCYSSIFPLGVIKIQVQIRNAKGSVSMETQLCQKINNLRDRTKPRSHKTDKIL